VPDKPVDLFGMTTRYLSSQSDSAWPLVLIIVVMGSFVLGITPTGNRLCREFVESLATKTQPSTNHLRPEVLLIGDSPSDERSVALTIAPRGYDLVPARNVPAGLEKLQSHAQRIGLIVLDSRVAEVGAFKQSAQFISPQARVVTIDAKHSTTELVGLLLNSMQN
jgi:hypothetical protein